MRWRKSFVYKSSRYKFARSARQRLAIVGFILPRNCNPSFEFAPRGEIMIWVSLLFRTSTSAKIISNFQAIHFAAVNYFEE